MADKAWGVAAITAAKTFANTAVSTAIAGVDDVPAAGPSNMTLAQRKAALDTEFASLVTLIDAALTDANALP